MQTIIILAFVAAVLGAPQLLSSRCPQFTYTTDPFIQTEGSVRALQQTQVGVCHTETYLNFTFVAHDNHIESTFKKCNEPLYEQDVVEIFIAPGKTDEILHDYLELEVSPYGVLFASHIRNPNGVCNGIKGQLIECSTSGIYYSSERYSSPKASGYNVTLNIPKSLVFGDKPHDSPLRTNFFRIDRAKDQPHQEFSCWSTTHTSPPCFHVPKYFGSLKLLNE